MDRRGVTEGRNHCQGIGGDHLQRGIALDGGDEVDGEVGRGDGKGDGDGIVEAGIAVDGERAGAVQDRASRLPCSVHSTTRTEASTSPAKDRASG